MTYCIAVFATTYETLRAEEFFRAQKIKFRPILKPRKIGSACRMALRFDLAELESAKKAAAAGKLNLQGYYRQENEQWIIMEDE